MTQPSNPSGRPRNAAPDEVNKIEGIKAASDGLRGNLAEEVNNGKSGFNEEGKQLLKFHGLYQQEDRDERKIPRQARPAEKTYKFMLRTRLPESVPLVGVGGILHGADAATKQAAGATLVQLYTGLIYRGPALVGECVDALRRRKEAPASRPVPHA